MAIGKGDPKGESMLEKPRERNRSDTFHGKL